jgi:MFS family permease
VAIGGVSFALLNLCSFFKGVDDSVLPAVFLEVGSTLGVGPQSLGTLGMIGAFSVGLAAPPSGWLGTRYSRPRLIAYGCFTWSIGAVGMGACSSYLMLALSRGINGIGLGIIGPLMYGMVVDSWEPHQRGKALGVLGITGSIGGLSGGWFATTVGSTTILGFAGWRFPLYVCALTGALIGVLVYACVADPAKAPGSSSTKQEEGIWETLTVRLCLS